MVTRWGSDPYARGAYSYFAVGNELNITNIISAPHGNIRFAGELAHDLDFIARCITHIAAEIANQNTRSCGTF